MAPTEAAGKSKIIDVAQYLVRAPEVVHDPTPASLYRMIQALEPTMFIDEMDMLYTSPAIKTVLNAGYRYGASIPRTETIQGQKVVVKYSCYCPKMFVGIAGKKLPIRGATLSRCIQLPMRRRTKDEPVAKFYHKTARRECEPIRKALAQWAEDNMPELEKVEPLTIPDGLEDREEHSRGADRCGLYVAAEGTCD